MKIILFMLIISGSGYVFANNTNDANDICMHNNLCSNNEEEVLHNLEQMADEYFRGAHINTAMMIWEKNIMLMPDANWAVLSKNISRLYAAETIASAVRNRFADYDVSQLRKFAQSQINSNSTDEVIKAISILRIVDVEEDAILIERAGSRGNKAILEEAVTALSMMCNSNSKEAAFSLANISRKEEHRRLLNSRVKALLKFKQQTNHCKPKSGYNIFID